MLEIKNELPFVEDTSLHDIIKVCQTPFYVYSQEMITNKVEITKLKAVPGRVFNPDYVEYDEVKIIIEDEVVSHTIDEKFYDAYEDWKNPDTEGSWQSFVKVCGGPVKAKEYRELIEANLPPSDGNTSP